MKTAQKFETAKFSLLRIPGIEFDGEQFDELRIRTGLAGGVPAARNRQKKQSQSERNGDHSANHEAFHERIEICEIMAPDNIRLKPKDRAARLDRGQMAVIGRVWRRSGLCVS